MIAPLTGFGFTAALPDGWEGRIFRRAVPTAAFTPTNRAGLAGAASAGRLGWSGEEPRGIVHLANFPLPGVRGDYGSGALELMNARQCFVALLEFGPECLGSALFAPARVAALKPGFFDPDALQRRLPGQSGFQHFFTENGRPLCLYVVLGSHRNADALTGQANQVLGGIKVIAP